MQSIEAMCAVLALLCVVNLVPFSSLYNINSAALLWSVRFSDVNVPEA